MKFNFQGYDTHNQQYHITPPSSSSTCTYFSDLAMKERLRRESSLRSEGFQGPNLRDLEKERIREEILAEEIHRRQILEAEVRRELMMEREMSMQRNGGFSSSFMVAPSRSHLYQFENGMLHGDQLEDQRIKTPFPEIYSGSGSRRPEIEGSDQVVAFQQETTEEGKHKAIINLGKPYDATAFGSKRKQPHSPPTTGKLRASIFSMKTTEEWSCAVCKVSATCESGLKEHLAGKKHLANIGTLKPKKPSFEIGLGTQSNSSKSVSVSSKEVNKSTKGGSSRLKFKFWCKMCKAGAHAEGDMEKHRKGKKHLKNCRKFRQKSLAGKPKNEAKESETINI